MAEIPFQFAKSSNGDTWSLSRAEETNELQVMHCANQPSGGTQSWSKIVDFLATHVGSPEHAALAALIDTIIADRFAVQVVGPAEMVMRFRDATEAEVMESMWGSKAQLPLNSTSDALEFFNCMIDLLTGIRQIENDAQVLRIPAGFGSTH